MPYVLRLLFHQFPFPLRRNRLQLYPPDQFAPHRKITKTHYPYRDYPSPFSNLITPLPPPISNYRRPPLRLLLARHIKTKI